MYQITHDVIKADIRAFEARISQARERLKALPQGHLPYPEQRKREVRRQELQNEIAHVLRLIGYAKEELNG